MSKILRVSAVLLVAALVFACSSTGSAWIKEVRGYKRTMVSANCVPLARAMIGVGYLGPVVKHRVLYPEDGVVWLKDSENLVEFPCGKKEITASVLWEQWQATENDKILENMKFKLGYELRPSDVCRLVESGVDVEKLDQLLLAAVRSKFHPVLLAGFAKRGDDKALLVYVRCAAEQALFDGQFMKEVGGSVQKLRVELVQTH